MEIIVFRFFLSLLFGFASSIALAADDTNFPKLDFHSLYQKVESPPFPVEYVFTDGANEPAFEPWGVPKFYVADLNNDQCDDIFFDWADSAAEPFVFFGNKSGQLTKSDVFAGHTKIRSIREADFADINNDGNIDIIGFSISHHKDQLGWGFFEPDFIALGNGDGEFSVLDNAIRTESHAGVVADLDHDGELDILPFNQVDKSFGLAVISETKITKSKLKAPNLSGYTIFDADAADLNGDGLDDLVLSVMPNHRKNKYVPPARLNQSGSLFIYFGDKNIPLSKRKPLKIGQHWASDADWEAYLKSRGVKSNFGRVAVAAPSNADLIDLDGDGDLDILVGYFVEHKSSWKSSGFQIYENDNGNFTLATDKFTPFQTSNRDLENPTDFIMDFHFADVDRDGKADLILSHLGEAHQSDADVSGTIFLNRNNQFLPVSLKSSKGLPRLATGNHERHIVPGDFNCDGRTDFATLSGAKKQHHDMFRVYLARIVPLPSDLDGDTKDMPAKDNVATAAACRFEITKTYADDPETYIMNKGKLTVTETGRIQFGDNQGYRQKGKSERQFTTLLQDSSELVFTDGQLIGYFKTLVGSKSTEPALIEMFATQSSTSFEGAYQFKYPGRGNGNLVIKSCQNVETQNIGSISKDDLRAKVACYMANAANNEAEELPSETELTGLITAMVKSNPAKVSKLALRRFGLQKQTITQHGDSLLEMLNYDGSADQYCQK